MTQTSESFHLAHDNSTNYRQIFYKKPIKKNNNRLEVEFDDSPQEIRRQKILQHQKDCRDAAFNAARSILDGEWLSDDDDDEPMEVDLKKHCYKKFNLHKNKLMMSEWMLEVPEDFREKWFMMPCPKGRRNLLIACKGKTRAYSRRGKKLAQFSSSLPNGNLEQTSPYCTILDCIWVAKQQTYYVLDALAWSIQPLLNCDAEFRRFWLQSKLEETPELKSRDTSKNQYKISSLPNISCNNNLSEFINNLSMDVPLDGFLFYHRDGQYMHGFTPLVTWLKPFMLPEVLGISVPSTLDCKPDGYIDFRHHINSGKSRERRTESCDKTMEIAEVDDRNKII